MDNEQAFPVIRQTVLDTTDPRHLAEFYRQLLLPAMKRPAALLAAVPALLLVLTGCSGGSPASSGTTLACRNTSDGVVVTFNPAPDSSCAQLLAWAFMHNTWTVYHGDKDGTSPVCVADDQGHKTTVYDPNNSHDSGPYCQEMQANGTKVTFPTGPAVPGDGLPRLCVPRIASTALTSRVALPAVRS